MFFEHLNFWAHSKNVILYFFVIAFSTTLVSPSSHNQRMIVGQFIFSAARGSRDWYDNAEREPRFRHEHLLSLFSYLSPDSLVVAHLGKVMSKLETFVLQFLYAARNCRVSVQCCVTQTDIILQFLYLSETVEFHCCS
jgi:hypothetical protein